MLNTYPSELDALFIEIFNPEDDKSCLLTLMVNLMTNETCGVEFH